MIEQSVLEQLTIKQSVSTQVDHIESLMLLCNKGQKKGWVGFEQISARLDSLAMLMAWPMLVWMVMTLLIFCANLCT